MPRWIELTGAFIFVMFALIGFMDLYGLNAMKHEPKPRPSLEQQGRVVSIGFAEPDGWAEVLFDEDGRVVTKNKRRSVRRGRTVR